MSNIKINPALPLPPRKSSTSGYSNNGGNNSGNKGDYSGQTFQDIFKQILENQSNVAGSRLSTY